MTKLAANLTMLYNEVDFLDRFEAAAKSGFAAVEYLFPYAYPKEQLAELLSRHRLVQVLHNLPAGDWAAGSRGIACLPDRVGEFQDGVVLHGELRDGSFVASWLTIVRWRPPHRRFDRTLMIVPGMAQGEALRRLRVRLRLG